MTDDEKGIVKKLCKRVVEEQTPEVFDELVVELNDLLERKQQRLEVDSN